MELAQLVYSATASFPKSEMYGLASQIQRAAVAIPSNIAEGFSRKHPKEFKHFLSIAYGSAAELETQLILSESLKLVKEETFHQLISLLTEIRKMLNKLMSVIKTG